MQLRHRADTESVAGSVRVAMAHTNCDDAAEQVQVAPTRVVEEPLHVALGDEQRLLVVRLGAGEDVRLLDRQHVLVAGALWAVRASVVN